MSNKGAHVPDTFVIERRLRPIYDWLDVGSYKKAIQECDKVLKKSSNLTRVKALKALALLRLGKEVESTQILNALVASRPVEDATLQAMSMCYRELQQYDQVCKLYEMAVKESPSNEELHTHLFMAYVRIADYKSQQQAAMTLYKMQPKQPYYCWAIMSIILQAQRGEGAKDDKKQKLLLSLAERMVDKLIQDNKMEAEPVQMYIIILEALKKYDKIIEVLQGPLGSKLDGDLEYNKLQYFIKLNQWTSVNTICRKLLEISMDRLDIWRFYLKSVDELVKNNNEEANIAEHSFEEANNFISKIVNLTPTKGYALRGPYLARLELAKIHTLNDVPLLFVEYFRKFGHKPCCVGDLRDYLILLSPEGRLNFSNTLLKEVNCSSAIIPNDEQEMQKHIGALQLSRLCGAHTKLDSDQAMTLVMNFVSDYQEGYKKFGKNVLPTEQGPADACILLAAHLLYDVYVKSTPKTLRPLLLAIILLKQMRQRSPSNFHIKLLLLRFYHVLGIASEAQSVYESLDIKHLQLDSMGHVHVAHLAPLGHFPTAHQLFDSTLRFFSTNYKDSSEHLTFSYKYGSFLKLTEFMDFRERMNNSFHYTWTAVDKEFLTIAQCATAESILQLELTLRDVNTIMSLMRNNGNLGVFVSWDPQRIATPLEEWPENKSIYEQDSYLLKMRMAILNCICAILQFTKGRNGVMGKLDDKLKELEDIVIEIRSKNFSEVEQRSISIGLPSRLGVYQKTPYQTIVLNSFKLIVSPEEEVDQHLHEKASDNIKEAFATFVTEVIGIVQCTNGLTFINNRNNFHLLCNFMEVTSIVVLVIVAALELTRSSKKKKQDMKTRDSIISLVISIKEGIRRVEKVLEAHSTSSICGDVVKDLSDKLSELNIADADEEGLIQLMLKSNETAFREIRNVLKIKLKLLNIAN